MQILSTLLFIFLCSFVINGTPITTTPEGEINNVEFDAAGEYSNSESYRSKKKIKLTEDKNSEVLNLLTIMKIMENDDPTEDPLKMCFAIFRNNDLLPLRSISESFNVFVTDVLLKRIRPLIIKNFTIANPIDRRFLPAYKTLDDMHNDALVLARCQFKFLFNISDGLESAKHELWEGAYFAKWLGTWPPLEYIIFNNSNFWLCGNSIFIPKAYVSNIAGFENTINCKYSNKFTSIIFHGSNIEVSTFLVGTKDEKELREKLLEWKYGLDFLKSHYIIAFHFMENEMITTNGNIFREIFNIEPFSMKFPAEWGKVVGLVHHNSTTNSLNDGEVFALIGLKKFFRRRILD